MRGFRRRLERGLPVLAALLVAACGEPAEQGRFEVRDADVRWANGRMAVRLEQDLRLGPEAREALRHGVPLTLGIELVLRDARTQNRLERQRSHYEIRYLPLSEHYQLKHGDEADVQTFPRLRHALAALGDLELVIETGALPNGEYELLARSYLDKRRMPPPMRLPVLFSPHWSHESAWTSWPLRIDAGA
jgi:hypothetical protein